MLCDLGMLVARITRVHYYHKEEINLTKPVKDTNYFGSAVSKDTKVRNEGVARFYRIGN